MRFCKRIPQKKKIQIGIVFVVVLILAVIVVLYFRIFAAGTDISNTATIYYTEGGQNKSAQSNTVVTTLTSPPALTINFSLKLQGRTNYSTTATDIKIFPVGGVTPLFEKTDSSTDAAGNGSINPTGVNVGTNYDFQIKVTNFLTKSIKNTTFNSSMNLNFDVLNSGDLDGNNIVNSLDFAKLSAKWGQSDPAADINQDGVVNTIDFALLNSNWFAQGT